MQKLKYYNGKQLILGRAGELLIDADPKTFEIVRKIFGKHGPYRHVLSKFGIGNDKSDKEFLVLLDGKVYSDVQIENEVLWTPCMSRLCVEADKAIIKPAFSVSNVFYFLGFIKKLYIETMIVAFPEKYLHLCEILYLEFCEQLQIALKSKENTLENFLKYYENVVYVTYIYELLYTYSQSLVDIRAESSRTYGGEVPEGTISLPTNIRNSLAENKVTTDTISCLKLYTQNNDYLLQYNDTYLEIKYRNKNGFSVVGAAELKKKILQDKLSKIIPSELPSVYCNSSKLEKTLVKLQCLKNNLRLKSDLLLTLSCS